MGAWAAQGELELRAQHGQRRPQLVARVGDEPPLVLERRLEPSEHVVQGRCEARDLVAGGWNRQAAGHGRSHRGGAAPHRLDRAKRRGGEPVSRERREQERERRREQELPQQAAQRLCARRERAGDDDHAAACGRCEVPPVALRRCEGDGAAHLRAVRDTGEPLSGKEERKVRRAGARHGSGARHELGEGCTAGDVAVDEVSPFVRVACCLARLRRERIVDGREQRVADPE